MAVTLLYFDWAMLKSLLQSLPEVDARIQSANRIALFLDFDGTDPDQAIMAAASG